MEKLRFKHRSAWVHSLNLLGHFTWGPPSQPITFCLHVTPPPTDHQLHKDRMELLHLHMPTIQQRVWPKAGAQQQQWMNAHMTEVTPPQFLKKWPQKCSRMPLTEANPTTIPYPWSTSTDHPLSCRLAPPQPHTKGRVNSHTSEERSNGIQQAKQFIFRFILFSASPSYPRASEANISFLSHP